MSPALLLILAQDPCAEGPCAAASSHTVNTALVTAKVREDERQIGGEPVIMGALPKEHIEAVVDWQMAAIQGCYVEALGRDPALSGEYAVKFSVDGGGAVSSVALRTDTVGDTGMAGCVLEVFQALRFDPPKGGGVVMVSYPLLFAYGGASPLGSAPPQSEAMRTEGVSGRVGRRGGPAVAYDPGLAGEDGLAAPGELKQLTFGELMIQGDLDQARVDAVFQRGAAQLRYCYQRALRQDPTLAGELTARLVIQADGAVSEVNTEASTLGSPAVEQCLSGLLLRYTFPAPEDGGVVTVSIPMRFSPG